MKRNLTKLGLALLVGITVVGGGLTSCKSTSVSSPKETDKKITSAVKDRLHHDPVFKFQNINVDTVNGIVQLSGFTPSEREKQRATEVAKYASGKEVINSILVQQ